MSDLTFSSVVPTASTTPAWAATWFSGSGVLLTPDERVQVTVNLNGLATPLGLSSEFTVELRPSVGSVLTVNRTTPAEFSAVVDLQ